jgi:nucleoside-diphosphate-sugar epimerase
VKTTPVLVTGGTGFIGRHLTRALLASGERPVVCGRNPLDIDLDSAGARFLPMDITDAGSIHAAFEHVKPTRVFHVAGTRRTEGLSVNTIGTERLLAEVMRSNVERVVLLGSAEEYGACSGPISENEPTAPRSPYGVSKAAATQLARRAHAEHGCPAVVIRPFTVYGPGQPAEMFVAEAVTCAVLNKGFLMSSGVQRRDHVFVDDVVRALIAASTAPGIDGEVLNVGSGIATPLREVAETIWRLSETTAPLHVGARPAAPHEQNDTWADIGLAQDTLGWNPTVDLEEGLLATIGWTREQHSQG